MLNSIILLGGLVSAFGLGAINPNQEKQDNNQFRLEYHKSVEYDDTDQEIIFTANELNNYTWDNLFGTIFNLSDNVFRDSSILYNDILCNFDEYISGEYLSYDYSLGSISLNFEDNIFELYLSSEEDYADFEYGLDWNLPLLSSEDYNDFKQAIELDIQANQPSNDYSPILPDIVSLLVGGITSFAGGLGAGVSALVGDIFINNGSLSVFGYMVVIFAGIALAIGLSRWVMNFLTSLGRKK